MNNIDKVLTKVSGQAPSELRSALGIAGIVLSEILTINLHAIHLRFAKRFFDSRNLFGSITNPGNIE